MSLIKRIINFKLSNFASVSMPQSEQGSGMNSVEKQVVSINGGDDIAKRNKEELKRFRSFRNKEKEEKNRKYIKNTKVTKILSKQPIMPRSIKDVIKKEKEIQKGDDMSPLI